MSYAEQWPHLARVTNDLETHHVAHVGAHLEDYSIEVQIDYADYTAFIMEYSEWSDRNETAPQTFTQSFDYDW